MPCEPAPPLTDLDLAALKERYRRERDKRLRPEGEDQYVEVSGDFADYWDVDPYSPPVVRDPICEDTDVVVFGGGFAGLMAASNLRRVGVDNFRIIEFGGDFGGTWYWNRYPGLHCDNEAYCYLPLCEETGYVPRQKYASGPEIFEHCQRIGRHFNLYERALFGTKIESLRWHEPSHRWRLTTNRGDDIRARFVIMCSGPFNRAKLPGIPGIKDYRGHSFHTSRWDYDYTGGGPAGGLSKLADKTVAIIGTGATALQAIPHLAEGAKHLYVFQRTPSAVDVRENRPTDPEWAASLKPGWQVDRQENFNAAVWEGLKPGVDDLVCDGWSEINRNMLDVIDAFRRGDVSLQELNDRREHEDYRYQEKLRRRVDSIVTDRETAEKLKAWYRFNCKRPTFSDDYLPTFNRANVTLIDVSGSPGVERITEKGLIANGVEYPVDCIVYASGFEVTTSIKRRMGIDVVEGRDGLSLYDHWKDGFKTYHGFTTHGFPNQFFTGYTQGGVSVNLTTMLHQQTGHIAYIIAETIKRRAGTVEVSEEAVAYWQGVMAEHRIKTDEFLMECTPGYYNNEGGSVRRSHIGEVYGPGINAFNGLLKDWREDGGMEGMLLDGKAGGRSSSIAGEPVEA
jgi:cation diffusion facilitator CzcD-associated flavoprotein CzcO